MARLAFRSSQSIQAENLILRRQLALYIERGGKPLRIDLVTRIGLTLLSRAVLAAKVLARPTANLMRSNSFSSWHDFSPVGTQLEAMTLAIEMY